MPLGNDRSMETIDLGHEMSYIEYEGSFPVRIMCLRGCIDVLNSYSKNISHLAVGVKLKTHSLPWFAYPRRPQSSTWFPPLFRPSSWQDTRSPRPPRWTSIYRNEALSRLAP